MPPGRYFQLFFLYFFNAADTIPGGRPFSGFAWTKGQGPAKVKRPELCPAAPLASAQGQFPGRVPEYPSLDLQICTSRQKNMEQRWFFIHYIDLVIDKFKLGRPYLLLQSPDRNTVVAAAMFSP